ncbi:hypothetical protein J4Q44_G00300220 [Coregonus suidteri]|uniref:Uncharacterized protein n=1 Tax=Coregonus suidteri TaxID=861788 RepID=A0AAN8QCT2_9TELE
MKDSTVTGVNIPQLVGLEDGTVLEERYGWQQHLTPYFRPLPQAVPALQLRCSGAWCCWHQGAFGLSRDQVSAAAQR